MNVYQKNYHPEFIKELPVDFNKIKNMDLSSVPTGYQGLFTTDWNWGRYSTMPMNQRMIYQSLFLQYHHDDTRASIELKKPVKEEIISGFPRD